MKLINLVPLKEKMNLNERNMEYVMFENTYRDLNDCLERLHQGNFDKLSDTELASALDMTELCKEVAEFYDELYDKRSNK